ncbi:MAG TPA: hypothetical protein VKY74_04900 [Chloroflexia bacterium]|nr:hypothetical protein [Chloroflexia bacterium]
MPARRRPPQPIRPGAAPPAPDRPAARATSYIVRASELGSYSYCHRAWWLRYVAGREPTGAGRDRLAQGHQRHAAHGRRVWLAGWLWRLGLIAAALAGAIGLLWLFSIGLGR